MNRSQMTLPCGMRPRLPLLVVLILTFCAGGAMTSEAAGRSGPVHIVAFGDSLTAGYMLPPKDAFPVQLQAALKAKGFDVVIVATRAHAYQPGLFVARDVITPATLLVPLLGLGIYLMLRQRSFPVILGLTFLSYAVNLFLFASGRLAQLNATKLADPNSFWLLCRADRAKDSRIQAFIRWVRREARA